MTTRALLVLLLFAFKLYWRQGADNHCNSVKSHLKQVLQISFQKVKSLPGAFCPLSPFGIWVFTCVAQSLCTKLLGSLGLFWMNLVLHERFMKRSTNKPHKFWTEKEDEERKKKHLQLTQNHSKFSSSVLNFNCFFDEWWWGTKMKRHRMWYFFTMLWYTVDVPLSLVWLVMQSRAHQCFSPSQNPLLCPIYLDW